MNLLHIFYTYSINYNFIFTELIDIKQTFIVEVNEVCTTSSHSTDNILITKNSIANLEDKI